MDASQASPHITPCCLRGPYVNAALANVPSPPLPTPFFALVTPDVQFTVDAKSGNRYVSSVGATLLPPALVTSSIPAGSSSLKVLNAVLLPAGVNPVPLPATPSPPPKKYPPRKTGGGGVGGFNSAVYYYRGCFNAVTSLTTIAQSSTMTPSLCAQAVATSSSNGAPYYWWALQNGNKCLAASNFAQIVSAGPMYNSACNTTCKGNSNQVSMLRLAMCSKHYCIRLLAAFHGRGRP